MSPSRPSPSRRPSRSWPALLCAAAVTVPAAQAQSPANIVCPDYVFLSGNLAANADFETPAPGTVPPQAVCWTLGDPSPPPSAADGWLMHSSNSGARVCSRLLPSTAPGAAPGSRMLMFMAGGNEGGVYQATGAVPGKSYVFSAWVKVLKGQVAMQPNGGNQGPASWSSKVGEWEQLRVCTNAGGDASSLVIYNQDAAGGTYLVDRVEFREMPVRP